MRICIGIQERQGHIRDNTTETYNSTYRLTDLQTYRLTDLHTYRYGYLGTD